ncbi:peptidoglycan-associated lipoprotein, partial [Methylophaga sp. SB9B]
MNCYKFSALLLALFFLNACSSNATKDGTDDVLV